MVGGYSEPIKETPVLQDLEQIEEDKTSANLIRAKRR